MNNNELYCYSNEFYTNIYSINYVSVARLCPHNGVIRINIRIAYMIDALRNV